MKLIVIADDFTGANDTGLQLAKKGACTEVLFAPDQKPSRRAQVLVINTESRGLSASEAAARVHQALADVLRDEPVIYKKIDSTFRGNIGAEIDAALHASGKQMAIIAAAIPAAGRTTQAGRCLVNDIPLDQTEYASDPKTPIRCSRIKTLIQQQSLLPVYEIPLTQIRAKTLHAQLAQYQRHTPCLLVLDALTDQDLAQIARAATQLQPRPLLVGAAGLASALPTDSYLAPRKALPVLIVAGSMSEVTRSQVNFALSRQRAKVVEIDVLQLLATDNTHYCQQQAQQAIQLLNQGQHCLLRTSRTQEDRHQIDTLCQGLQLTRAQLGAQLSAQVGKLTLAILDKARTGGLFLTGGDMAMAVASALGAEGYRISAEVAPCIPCGSFINSDIDDLPVITKAGGFGQESVLCDALAFIEEMYND